MTQRLKLTLMQIGAALVVLGLWAMANATGTIDTSILPPVNEVAARVLGILVLPEFHAAFANTVVDAARGLSIAAGLAIPVGILIGMFPALDRATRVVLDFGRSFPVIALLPILVLLFGATAMMKIVAITIACFFPILLQSIYGARRLEPTIVDTVRSYRIPALLRFTKVMLPAAGPYIATGLRIASTVSILVAVGVEIVSLAPGMGREISLARSYAETATALAYIVYAGLLGVALNMVWDWLESRLLKWHLRAQAE